MSQFPPVGDIKLTKVANTYNTYRMEISYGQLEVIREALKKHHAEPIADELLAMLDYYTQNLPGPGEEKEDKEAREEGAAQAEDDFPIPMPPGQETALGQEGAGAAGPGGEAPTDQLPELPTDDAGAEGVPDPGASGMETEPGDPGVEGDEEGPDFPDLGGEEPGQTADRHLPAPPSA